MSGETLLIEASNINGKGGGITHLREFLSAANFEQFGIAQVIVCASSDTLEKVAESSSSHISYKHSWLNGSILHRIIWRWLVLPTLLKDGVLLFIPGTGAPFGRYPFVTMCRNLLPIDRVEMDRFKYSKDWFRYQILRRVHFSAFKRATGLICMNEYVLQVMPAAVRSRIQNLQIIPHGVNPLFLAEPKKNYRLSDPLEILYVSRINLYKHQWTVAEATYLLNEMGVPARLTLIGDQSGYGEGRLEAVMEKYKTRFPGVVTIRPEVPFSDLPDIYRATDIFVFASTCETFGLILLEAMSCGLPIACSDRSSMPGLLEDAGLYFDPEDSESLLEALVKLCKDESLRSRLGKKARSLAMKYQVAKSANETLQFIIEVLGNPTVSYHSKTEKNI